MNISHGQWAYLAIPRLESGEFLTPFFVGRRKQTVSGKRGLPSQRSVVGGNGKLRDAFADGATRVVLVPALDVEEYGYPTLDDEEIAEWRLEERVEKVWVRQ